MGTVDHDSYTGEEDRKEKHRIDRYFVLYTQQPKQYQVTEVIQRSLPEDMGIAFYPCVELWMGSLGETVIEPMFPGYVFIRSKHTRKEMHRFLKERRREILSYIRELHAGQEKIIGKDAFDDNLTDLTPEESEFLDFMLGFRYKGSGDKTKIEKSGNTEYIEIESKVGKKGKKIRKRRVPKHGVLEMSYGYKEGNGKIVVMDGPLKGYEDYFRKVDIKDRRVYLNMRVGDRWARAGLTIDSKKHWFPKDEEAPVILSDGYVLDPKSVAEALMKPKDDEGENHFTND